MADASVCYDCCSLETAAKNAHLPCLRKFWLARFETDDAKLLLLLHAVASHRSAEWLTSSGGLRERGCTSCLRFLLEAGSVREISRALNFSPTNNIFLNVAAAGCVPCLQTVLDFFFPRRRNMFRL
jgi:hypothetical protein